MQDLTEFTTKKKRPCIVARNLEKLSKDDRAKFEAACTEPTILTAAISRWLAEHSASGAKYDSVRLHRAKECCCYA